MADVEVGQGSEHGWRAQEGPCKRDAAVPSGGRARLFDPAREPAWLVGVDRDPSHTDPVKRRVIPRDDLNLEAVRLHVDR